MVSVRSSRGCWSWKENTPSFDGNDGASRLQSAQLPHLCSLLGYFSPSSIWRLALRAWQQHRFSFRAFPNPPRTVISRRVFFLSHLKHLTLHSLCLAWVILTFLSSFCQNYFYSLNLKKFKGLDKSWNSCCQSSQVPLCIVQRKSFILF